MTTDPTKPHICTADAEAWAAENARLREQLAEAREHWRQVADALARAETERDQARAEIARLERAAQWIAEDRLDRLRRQVLAVAEDLERYASDPRPEAPETGLSATQTGEQTGVRVETGTEPASARVDLVIGLRQRGVPQHPDGPEAAALAEIDRLRAALNSQGGSR